MKTLFIFLAAAILIVRPNTPGLAAEPAVGEKAPAFSLPGSDGKTYDLASFKDKQVVVLAWFPKAFTGG